jgi:hypothetical protein
MKYIGSALFLLLGTFAGLTFGNDTKEIDISLTLGNEPIVGEPSYFRVTYRNLTGREIRIEDMQLTPVLTNTQGSEVAPNTGIEISDGCVVPFPETTLFQTGYRPVVLLPETSVTRTYVQQGYLPTGTYQLQVTLEPRKCGYRARKPVLSKDALQEGAQSNEVRAQIREPEGSDTKVWHMMKERFERGAQWAFAGEGTAIGEEKAKQIVTLYPESRYAPYALFYILMDFEGFIGKYPDHLLAPLAYHHRIEHLVRQNRLRALVERDAKRHAIQGVQKLVTALREKYPDSGAAWYAGYMEKWLSLLDRYQAEGPTMALHGEVEKFVGDAPRSWVKKEAEILARKIPMILEEWGERKRAAEQPKAPAEKQPE